MTMTLPKFKFNPDEALRDQLHLSLVPANVHLADQTFPTGWTLLHERDKNYRKIKPADATFGAEDIVVRNDKGESFQLFLRDIANITIGVHKRPYSDIQGFTHTWQEIKVAVIAVQIQDGTHYYLTLPSFEFVPLLIDYAQQHHISLNDPDDLAHKYADMTAN